MNHDASFSAGFPASELIKVAAKTRASKYGIATFLLSSLLAGHAGAQNLSPLSIEDLLHTRQFGVLSPVAFSPDGNWLAYAVLAANSAGNRKGVHSPEEALLTGIPLSVQDQDIWIINLRGGGARDLTEDKGSNWAAKWSPDSQHLAFISDRDGGGQPKLWVWDARANEIRKVADAIVRAEEIQWLPDGKSVLVTLLPESMTAAEYAQRLSGPETPEADKTKTPGSTVTVYRSLATSQGDVAKQKSDPWSLDYAFRDLAKIEISGKVNRIESGRRIQECAISPDGSYVAFTSPKRFERPGSQQVLFDIVTLDIATKEDRVVVQDTRLSLGAMAFSWSPDSSLLSYQVIGVEGFVDLYIVGAHGGVPRKITNLPRQRPISLLWPPLWDRRGENVYFVSQGAIWKATVSLGQAVELVKIPGRRLDRILAQSRGLFSSPDGDESAIVFTVDGDTQQTGFYKVDLKEGRASKLLEDGRCYYCARQAEPMAVSQDGRQIAYFASDASHDNDIWLTDRDFKKSRRLTHLNPQFDGYQMGSTRLIEWRGLDGERLKGALLLPAGYHLGKQYPLIVSVYGGALHSSRLNHFGLGYGPTDNMQLFATRGYAVLLPDAPQHLGTPMVDLAKTVLPGVDKVIEMGIADPERLAVMGHSYGGYSALALIVQTRRFKAALMSAGFGDAMAFYGQLRRNGSAYGIGILESGQGLMGGTPWQFRQRYIENSPIFYLDRVETPLLIVHGGADDANDPYLTGEVFVGLRRLGKAVEYARYEGEDHHPFTWSYANQVDFCNRMIAWFDEHLTKPQDIKEQSPTN